MPQTNGSPDITVINLLQLTGALINTCYELECDTSLTETETETDVDADKIRSDPIPDLDQLDKITDVLIQLRGVFERAARASKIKPPPGSGAPATLVDQLKKTISQLQSIFGVCRDDLRALETLIPGGPEDDQIDPILEKLKEFAVAFGEILTKLGLPEKFTMDARFSVFNNVAGDQNHYYSEAENSVRKTIKWLSAPDPSSNHRANRDLRESNTGSWLLEGDLFKQWLSSARSLFWLYGIPGAGKTVICSTIIEAVKTHCDGVLGSALAYFYFDFADPAKQTADQFVRSLIMQLSARVARFPESLTKIYTQSRDGNQQPSTKDLLVALQDALRLSSSLYVVVDALDECTDRKNLLRIIGEILEWDLPGLHFLLSSRTERDIEEFLTPKLQFKLNLSDENIDTDMQVHIKAALERDVQLQRWPVIVQIEIVQELAKKAKGMFRWVTCQLEILKKCLNVRMLRITLASLPASLGETYARILVNIDVIHQTLAYRVLQWLCCSARAVTLLEIIDAAAADCDANPPLFNSDQRLLEPQYLLEICSSLVTIVVPPFDTGTKSDPGMLPRGTILKLAHHSVKEYLMSDLAQKIDDGQFYVETRVANSFIARTCLIYLLLFDSIDNLNTDKMLEFPLAEYAAEFWSHHARLDETLTGHPLVMALLQPQNPQLLNWVRIFNCDFNGDNLVKRQNLRLANEEIGSPLYYASALGLDSAVQQLLAGVDTKGDVRSGYHGSPLHAASSMGYEGVVRLLIAKGANVDLKAAPWGTALAAASYAGHTSIVRLLIEKGAHVNVTNESGEHYGSALQHAALESQHEIVVLLIEQGAIVNEVVSQYGVFGSALQVAAQQGPEETAQLLIDKGADVNSPGGDYGTALQAAAYWGNKETVKLLIEKGADINARPGPFGNALKAASSNGVIVRLLMDHGATVEEDVVPVDLVTPY